MDGSAVTLLHELRGRVSDGSEAMDRKRPDWYLHVNLDTLNMGSFFHDVLGQVFGTYAEGVDRLDLEGMEESERLGFTINGMDGKQQDDLLTDLWVEQIQYRLDHSAEFPIDE